MHKMILFQNYLSIENPYFLFPPLTLNLLFVGTACILGVALQQEMIHKYWHHSLFLIGLLHYGKVLVLQHKSLVQNSRILSDLGKELESVLNSKGVK